MLILEKTILCGQVYDLRNEDEPRGHPFSTHEKFSEELTFLTS